ncbi:MAG: DAK2 domain-containing protein [Anaerolineae bacterium]
MMTIRSDSTTQEGPGRREPLVAIDGQVLKTMLRGGQAWLENHVEVVNNLNVFPVPDGDTGTNMLLTMHSTMQAIAHSPERHLGRVAAAAAQGALMGARGNSGVILSQILRGLAASLEQTATGNVADFARALQRGSDTAYESLVKPVEGTILTVIRAAAAAAGEASRKTNDFIAFLEITLKAAQDAERTTPTLLPVLKEAGVVDAGGQGLVYILEGGWRSLTGDGTAGGEAALAPAAVPAPPPVDAEGYGYDVQFLIHGRELDVATIRAKIDAMGDSTLVVGDEHLVKVHVHVPDPGLPISFGASLGVISDVVVENMDAQHEEFAQKRSGLQTQARPITPAPTEELTDIAVVAVATGGGFRRIFESLGISAIVSGGQTMNPSTQEFLEVVENLAADQVLILPNNSNIILAAQQTAQLSRKEIHVVPTRTIPQGISALLAFNFQGDAATNAGRMLAAAQDIQTVEVTQAVRKTRLNGIDVNEGDVIGLLNNRLISAGADAETVVMDVLAQVGADGYEIATIYFGKDASPDEAEALARHINTTYPDLEIEVLDGGQAHYPYILSLE